MTPALARGDGGQVGGVEALIFGVLVFVFGTLMVANAWGAIDAKMASAGAARASVRAYVEAGSAVDADRAASAAAREAILGAGRNPDRMHLALSGTFERCARIVAAVSYRVPIVTVPLLGGFGPGLTVTARHSEVVDPFRSGLRGTSLC